MPEAQTPTPETPTPSATPMADTTVQPDGQAPMAVPETPPVQPETPPVQADAPPPPQPTPEAQPSEWLNSLPEELRGHEKLSSIKSVEDLARQFAEAGVAPAVPDADKYALPEGTPAELGAIANKLGYTQEQLEGTVKLFQSTTAARDKGMMDALAQSADAKLVEWGEQKDTHIGSARAAVAYWEGKVPGIKQMLDQTGYGHHPLVMELFRLQGEELREGGFLPSSNNTPQNVKSTANVLYPDHK